MPIFQKVLCNHECFIWAALYFGSVWEMYRAYIWNNMVDKRDRGPRKRRLEEESPLKFQLPGFHRHPKVFPHPQGRCQDSRQSYLDLQGDKVAGSWHLGYIFNAQTFKEGGSVKLTLLISCKQNNQLMDCLLQLFWISIYTATCQWSKKHHLQIQSNIQDRALSFRQSRWWRTMLPLQSPSLHIYPRHRKHQLQVNNYHLPGTPMTVFGILALLIFHLLSAVCYFTIHCVISTITEKKENKSILICLAVLLAGNANIFIK